MKKPLIKQYTDELKYNHDIHGVPRVRAEWNWNHTSLLANPARRGVRMKVYDGAGLPAPANATQFGNIFTTNRLKKELNHTSCNWTHTSNTPDVDWTGAPNFNPATKTYFGVEQTFFIHINEPGRWKFFMASDDSHELWIEGVKVTSHYGGRIMAGPPVWTEEGAHTFNSPGRYFVRIMMHNIDKEWGVFLGYQSPTMASRDIAPREIERDLVVHPDEALGPYSNPEMVNFNPDSSSVSRWDEWREYFPISSIVEKNRPVAGIHYNEFNSRGDGAWVMNDENYIQYPNYTKPHRWYTLDRNNQGYRYWKSDRLSSSSGALTMEPVRVHYNDWVGVNKISFTANLGAEPRSLEIRAFVRDHANDPGKWEVVLNRASSINWNNYHEGQLSFYRTPSGAWNLQPFLEDYHVVYENDYSAEVSMIEFTIFSLSKSQAPAEVIEFSARKQLDITNRVIDFSGDMTMEDTDFTRILGKMSANDGLIQISNWDNAFQMPEEVAAAHGVERLSKTVERSTRFTIDLMYDLSEQGMNEPYPVRMFTMYSSDWRRNGEFDYEVNLFDSAKFLQNVECPDVFEKSIRLHELVAQILDSVGFTRYTLDTEDFALQSPVLEYFANDPDSTVWETLQKIAEATLCAIYFDEYDVLKIITKDEITRDAPAEYQLLGQKDPLDPQALPNIVHLEKRYDQEANKVTIKWRDKSVKKEKVDIDPQELTDLIWQSSDTVVLRATKLVKPLSYSEENEFWIGSEDAIDWPYQGKANINGEIVEWDGKEYSWIDGRTGMVYKETVRSDEELKQKDAKALYGYNRFGVNKFTGRIFLRREEKTGRPMGRGVDPSKYRVDHPIDRRPGWNAGMFTVGSAGVVPGYWPGEKNTSFYTINNPNDNTTAIGLNRPTNRNDDWFKTQILYRSASFGASLQQWGFRVRFKESTTIGEVSLMFNMGTSVLNNGELATTAAGPLFFNQMYQITFLESQGLVRNATHEIGAWVQTPDPVFRTWDNAIRGSASRMYNRNYWEPWAERMKGYRFEFKRDVWYDIKVDLTRGRGYLGNEGMHFFVWVNGSPVGGFDAAGPANRHKYLAPTNYWAIGSRTAAKVEIANAYSWTEFADPKYDEDQYKWDFINGGYVSSYLENGLLYPAKGKSAPYRDGAQFAGEFFFDDFGSIVHEIREFNASLDKAPAETVKSLISNPAVRELELSYSPNKAKFSVVNTSDQRVIAHGQEDIGGGNQVSHSMALYGYILTEDDENSITRENKDSIKDRGEVKEEITAEWINSKEAAENLGRWVVKTFSDPKDVVEITVFGDASFSVGDRVNIHYDKADIEKYWLYMISGVSYSYSTDGLEAQLVVRRVRDNEIEDDDW